MINWGYIICLIVGTIFGAFVCWKILSPKIEALEDQIRQLTNHNLLIDSLKKGD